ncbi:HPr family phosphocarrier protein [Spirochaeta africana]|uniref:Phosphotransferase system HPr (HPr) family protein n=1 Tax=Spirochaeta africana (strain ATCC 700263 / DSM 8902 / Z-7692) TaxID=889378 RepID=H9UGI0_SPIAZ|nr:HPr family phosphocarrier protein [Spirochaeta africana]AFG36623.1 phosphotransferase system HPr (HPr) family protein [Spirochaeta africana DSM 8902]
MITRELTVTNPKGIHVRPSGLLYKAALKHQSRIVLSKNGQQADCREIVMILALGAQQGDIITLQVEGPDEVEAAAEIEEIFSLNFMDTD